MSFNIFWNYFIFFYYLQEKHLFIPERLSLSLLEVNYLYPVLWDLTMRERGVFAELGEVWFNGLGHVAQGELLVHNVSNLRQVLLGLGVQDDGWYVCIQDCLYPPCDLPQWRGDKFLWFSSLDATFVHHLGIVNMFEPFTQKP